MRFHDLPRLRLALANLPGEEAQYRMAPALRRQRIPESWTRQGVRESAVFILLFPRQEHESPSPAVAPAATLHTVLMQRPVYQGAHSGQISFPGGRHEASDADLQHTALREMEEEIGVPAGQVQVLGPLSSLYVPVSHSNIQPYVGYLAQEPVFRPDPREVQDLLVTSLPALFDDRIKSETEIVVSGGARLLAPYYAVQDRVVWGATAMIISELEALVRSLDQG